MSNVSSCSNDKLIGLRKNIIMENEGKKMYLKHSEQLTVCKSTFSSQVPQLIFLHALYTNTNTPLFSTVISHLEIIITI